MIRSLNYIQITYFLIVSLLKVISEVDDLLVIISNELVLLFFRYSSSDHHGTKMNNMKSSVQRGVRAKVVEQFPYIEDYLDEILPKKETLIAVKL
jgi:hypothetical protein